MQSALFCWGPFFDYCAFACSLLDVPNEGSSRTIPNTTDPVGNAGTTSINMNV